MQKGDYKDTVKEQPGSAGVVNAVANDKGGIGYSGIGYRTADVRAVPLAKTGNDMPVEPTFANALAGKYPLGRTLVHLRGQEAGQPAARAFARSSSSSCFPRKARRSWRRTASARCRPRCWKTN